MTSVAVTRASFSIASTIAVGVGTKWMSGVGGLACCAPADAAAIEAAVANPADSARTSLQAIRIEVTSRAPQERRLSALSGRPFDVVAIHDHLRGDDHESSHNHGAQGVDLRGGHHH